MNSTGCPGRPELLEFSTGNLPRPVFTRLAAHIERCPECLQALEGFDHEADPLLALLGQPVCARNTARDAVPQALRLLGWFGRTAGWDRRNLLLLTDFGGSNDPGTVESPAPNITPTKKNLDWAFRDKLFSDQIAGVFSHYDVRTIEYLAGARRVP